MKNKLLQTTMLLMAILTFSLTPYTTSAQDTGPVAMQNLSFYSLMGGGIGAIAGAALWALDPLGPSSDISNSAYTGLSLGILIGTIWGITLMQEQAIIPYNPNQAIPDESEFDGDFGQIYPTQQNTQKEAMLPLIGMEYRF